MTLATSPQPAVSEWSRTCCCVCGLTRTGSNGHRVHLWRLVVLIEYDGNSPSLADDVYVAPTAVVSGDVRIGRGCRVLFGAVITADGGRVELGEDCIVMENAVVRGRPDHQTRLGNHVLVGPHSHINGAAIEDDVFIATGVSVFPGARIETRSEVRINGVVHVNTRLEADTTVPIGWVCVGDPATLFPPGVPRRDLGCTT